MIAQDQKSTPKKTVQTEVRPDVPLPSAASSDEVAPRIALMTPYTGGNLGDAAIQDAMIANLRLRMPGSQFLGITLNCVNFLEKHGGEAFPLLATPTRLTHAQRTSSNKFTGTVPLATEDDRTSWKGWRNGIRRMLRAVPGVVPFLRRVLARMATIQSEIRHSYEGYRVLRSQDLLVVSGGGQLDEEWGGAWRLPFAMCKWVLLSRMAGVPCAVVSVGAGKITSTASRRLFSVALRLCCYRSYRETKTRAIAARLLPRATSDPVVPDLAFGLQESELPSPDGDIRRMAHGRPVIAISPIAYGKPGNWPTPDSALHDRYVQQMAQLLSLLSRQGYYLVVVCSSLGDDEEVIPGMLGRLDDEMKLGLESRIHFPPIKAWKEVIAVLRDVDYLVASRLHGTILGFVSQTPVVAISFDPKVDWVMEDLQQTDCLLQIRHFTAEQVVSAVDRMKIRRDAIVKEIVSYRQSILSATAQQYDSLARLALAHHQSHN
jgi:polysaccharide pyruvyl transferase WcaK-like protein